VKCHKQIREEKAENFKVIPSRIISRYFWLMYLVGRKLRDNKEQVRYISFAENYTALEEHEIT
jgi:hypothetical protein